MNKRKWFFVSQCLVACALIIVLLISILGVPWAQAWSSDPTENTAICTAPDDQETFAVVSTGSGNTVITWEDYRSGTNNDIYAQKLDSSGIPQWTTNGVAVCTASDGQIDPTIVSDGSGGTIIIWEDHRSGSSWDIYAQRVDSSGVPQWTTNGVAVCTASGHQRNQATVSDGLGGAIITWQDKRSGTDYDIYAQRVDSSGVPQWTADGVAVCTAGNGQYVAAVVSDGSGGAIITWEDYRSGTSDDIYAQRVDSSGVPQWTANGVAICTASYDQWYPTPVSDGSGGAIITWTDYRSGTYEDIYAQRVDSSGVPQWTANGVAVCTASDDQRDATTVSDGSGGAIITWEDRRSGGSDIYAQRVDPSGVAQWTANGVAICTAPDGQWYPDVVSDSSGGAIIAWEDYRSGTYEDIYAQRVNPSGVPQWTANGVAVCTASWQQYYPIPVSDGSGGTIITWQDKRSENEWDIYAQRVTADGSLNGVVPTITPTPIPTPTLPPSGMHTWPFCTAGFFPQHMPDSYNSEVVLGDLNPSAIPPEVQGVYWYDCSTSDWKFWAPGVPGTTLTSLGGGHTYDYMVTVTGSCDWDIPFMEGPNTITGIELSPPSPAQLNYGDHVDVTFDYTTDDPGGVYIWANPYTDGSFTPDGRHHGSPLYPAYAGSGSTYLFANSGPVEVDQIYFLMRNADQSVTYLEFFADVSYGYGIPPNNTHTWPFCTAGFFPQHMPDSYNGEVVLGDLDPAEIPPEVQGVYWYDCSTSEWKFWAPGVPGTTLTTLGGGHTYDYMVTVTGDCDWEISLP